MFNNVATEGIGYEQATFDIWALRQPSVQFASVVEPYENAPDECTIFPLEASEADRMTTWISAAEGSYVSVEEMC